MMIAYKSPVCTIGIISMLLFGYVAQAQSTMDQTLINLQKQAAANPFEKVYLHMDKPYYGAGDTIWFKGYTVTGTGHRLSGISGILNVELVNDHNAIIQNIKLPMVTGLSYGDFPLPDTLTEGNYRIRAWTNWMRNAGPDYFFDQTLPIINAATNKVFIKAAYNYTDQNTGARISYTDIDRKPYNSKEVKFEVKQDNKTLATGSGVTDAQGNLNISFTNKMPDKGSISIITKLRPDDKKQVTKEVVLPASATMDVQFFPEGGYLINGIASKVAFKAVGNDGLGKDIKGIITDDQNNQVETFTSTHLGMGTFMFAPAAGKTYTAKITYPDGPTTTVALPKAKNEGYILAVNNASPANIGVKITSVNTNDLFTLIAQSGGEVFYEGKSTPGKTMFVADIPKSKISSGIVRFTLFSNSGEPLNERTAFIQNPDKLNLTINTAQKKYASRQRVRVELNARNSDGQAVIGNFSAAVVDETEVPIDETAESTILSTLLLTSDLKGYIEKPNYYFAGNSPKVQSDLDILMLTQGYSRYEWKKVINNEIVSPVYQREKELSISGRIMTVWDKPVVNNKVFLINKSSNITIDTVTDNNGRFVFDRLAFSDTSKFLIKTPTEGDKDNVKIELDNDRLAITNKSGETLATTGNIDSSLNVYLKVNKQIYDGEVKYGLGGHDIGLKEVNINTTSTRKKSLRQIAEENATMYSSNAAGPGNADQIFTYEDLEKFGGSTLWEVLSGRISGIDPTPGPGGVPVMLRAVTNMYGTNAGSKNPMLVVVDGNKYADLPEVSNIASVEILKSILYRSAYGSYGGDGVIVITTKHGGQETIPGNPPGILNFNPQGYYKAHLFYSPKYDIPAPNKAIPDFRTTIYWKPIIQTDKNGNTSFDYFNGDSKGNYRVVVEGIDNAGHIGRQVYRYKVD